MLITDRNVRRALRKDDDIRGLPAGDVMTRSPVTVGSDTLLQEALARMGRGCRGFRFCRRLRRRAGGVSAWSGCTIFRLYFWITWAIRRHTCPQ
jgi:CBS domain-containing protein